MAEPHDELFTFEQVPDERLGPGRLADLLQHAHGLLVGAAVQGPFERGHCGRDGRVHVCEGGGHHSGGERRGVHGVVGVEDEDRVEDLGGPLLGLLAGQHVEEVRGVRELWVRLDDREFLAVAVVVGDEGRHERDQPDGLAVVGLR